MPKIACIFWVFCSKSASGRYIGVYKGRGALYTIWRQSFIYFETKSIIEVIKMSENEFGQCEDCQLERQLFGGLCEECDGEMFATFWTGDDE
jgi:hypothetical protein